jgi:hypothetical protein
MPITLIKHLDGIEIVEAPDGLPLDVPIVLYAEDEVAKRMDYGPEEWLQLQAIAAEEEDDWGAELDSLAEKSI